jgi:hypothetical protein
MWPSWYLKTLLNIDYRCKIVVFECLPVAWQLWTPIRFPAVKQGFNPGIRSWKSTCLIEPDVRELLVLSILQKSEELSLYNVIQNLTISNPALKVLFSNASRGWTIRLFGGWWLWFSERGRQDLSNVRQCRLLISTILFCLHIYSLWF